MSNNLCEKCNQSMDISCPCGKCEMKTSYSVCSFCEHDQFMKMQKMHGLQVCEEYVMSQLGM